MASSIPPQMGGNIGPHSSVKVNLNDMERIQCDMCESELFTTVWRIHKIPAMLSQTGQESLFPVEFFRCNECGALTKIVHGK